MSYQAYHSAQKRAESPRETEYRLFAQVTRALVDADAAGREDLARRIDAIDWNRRVWSTLATDCALPENRLSPDLRAAIISLSLWVGRYSSEVMREGASMEPLIDVNRTIMEGLRPQGAAAGPAEPLSVAC